MDNFIDYYKVLNVSYFATKDEIKDAYRIRVKETHPDNKNGDSKTFKIVKEAYDLLSNDEKRNRYNDFLFKYTKVNTPVNNFQREEVPPKQSTSAIRSDTKKKVWKPLAVVSLVVNAVLIGVAFWGYSQLIEQEYIITEIQTDVESVTKELSDFQVDYNTLNGLYVSLENEYREYIEQTETKDVVKEATNNEIPIDNTEDISKIVANNPAGAFTQGSSKDHVKKIMGTPSSLNKMPLGEETWWYGGTAFVNFNEEGLVEGWTDIKGDTLKVQ
ncbi:J domain-containing protein [Bacillus sp. FJAT-49870]|uniref:J domain-containing protein n=1 Tax=Lederbergia citri TaxID=2833580 RepID=A0A942TB92_9BACI|nr:J domain-containing protein [Lederbergia citri]